MEPTRKSFGLLILGHFVVSLSNVQKPNEIEVQGSGNKPAAFQMSGTHTATRCTNVGVFKVNQLCLMEVFLSQNQPEILLK